MKTYVFHVELEPDEDGWHVFYPPWRKIGASTWGATRAAAMQNIREVLELLLEEFEEEGQPVAAAELLTIAEGSLVAVNR